MLEAALTLACGIGVGFWVPEFGVIVAVAMMGGFLLRELRRR